MDFYHYDFYRISKREEEGAGEEESDQQFPVKQPCCLSPQFCPVAELQELFSAALQRQPGQQKLTLIAAPGW